MLFTELYSNCFYSRKPTIWPLKILTEQHQGQPQFFHMYNSTDPLLAFLLLIAKIIFIKYNLNFLHNYLFDKLLGMRFWNQLKMRCLSLLQLEVLADVFISNDGRKSFGSRQRWLKFFKYFSKKFLNFERFSYKKGKNDNWERFHTNLD
jgi:hypothetical protein